MYKYFACIVQNLAPFEKNSTGRFAKAATFCNSKQIISFESEEDFFLNDSLWRLYDNRIERKDRWRFFSFWFFFLIYSFTHCGDMIAIELRGSTIAVKIRLEMVMKIIRTVVEFLKGGALEDFRWLSGNDYEDYQDCSGVPDFHTIKILGQLGASVHLHWTGYTAMSCNSIKEELSFLWNVLDWYS